MNETMVISNFQDDVTKTKIIHLVIAFYFEQVN